MNTANYTKDILHLMPDLSLVKIYTTDADFMQKLGETTCKQSAPNIFDITLSGDNRKTMNIAIDTENIQEYLYRLEITLNGKLLFEGYDSMEYGKISKDITFTGDFAEKYIEDEEYFISEEW